MSYQASFGAEHMLTDTERARSYFTQEYEATPADSSIPLYEPVSENFCRVNLAAWKARDLNSTDLFDLFIATANNNAPGTETDFNNFVKSAEALIAEGLFPFSLDEWQNYYTAYKANGMHPVHHSDAYRQAERPAYRLIKKSLLPADII